MMQRAFADMSDEELRQIILDHMIDPFRGIVSNYVAARSELAGRGLQPPHRDRER